MPERLRIGERARRAHCRIDTIRYYESQGLLPVPERSEGSFRLYGKTDVERVRFIRYCRSLDMSLAEIGLLVGLRDHPEEECGPVVALLEKHVALVGRRIAELQSLERSLRDLQTCCQPGEMARDCGILQELTHGAGEQLLEESS
jgi:Cd(II)/Pb(II)-responsive transcriptional regulator